MEKHLVKPIPGHLFELLYSLFLPQFIGVARDRVDLFFVHLFFFWVLRFFQNNMRCLFFWICNFTI
jgi:hypothetical protein